MSVELPPSLAWAPLFTEAVNRALDGDVVSWSVLPRVDPLQWVLTLTMQLRWSAPTSAFARTMLQAWCEANNAELGRAGICNDRTVWSALVLLRGLRPETCVNPYIENKKLKRLEKP